MARNILFQLIEWFSHYTINVDILEKVKKKNYQIKLDFKFPINLSSSLFNFYNDNIKEKSPVFETIYMIARV